MFKKIASVKIFTFIIIAYVFIILILFIKGKFINIIDISNYNEKIYSREQLSQDVKHIEKCILNENPLIFTDRTSLATEFKDICNKISEDGMTEEEFYKLVNPLITSINCGHTNLSISNALYENRKLNAKYFPLEVTLIDDKLFIIKNYDELGINIGDQIISINDTLSNDIITTLLSNISSDGDSKEMSKYILSKHFNNIFYNFFDDSTKFKIIVKNNSGEIKNYEINAKYKERYNTTAKEMFFLDIPEKYYTSEIFEDYAILDINIFFNDKKENSADYLESFFTEINNKNISALIIDIRGNYGGDLKISRNLLSYLIDEEKPYLVGEYPFIFKLLGFTKSIKPSEFGFKGNVVLLTDGAVFSTAGHFISLFKYYNIGKIIGRETGGNFICTDNSKEILLKNTKMKLKYSRLIFQTSAEGFDRSKGIYPDYYIPLTLEEVTGEFDKTLDYSLKYLEDFK